MRSSATEGATPSFRAASWMVAMRCRSSARARSAAACTSAWLAPGAADAGATGVGAAGPVDRVCGTSVPVRASASGVGSAGAVGAGAALLTVASMLLPAWFSSTAGVLTDEPVPGVGDRAAEAEQQCGQVGLGHADHGHAVGEGDSGGVDHHRAVGAGRDGADVDDRV